MKVQIQALHFDASENLTAFIHKKVSKLTKYSDEIINTEVILKVVKPEVSNNKEASIRLVVKNAELFANKIADTFEEAIDTCIEALEKQIVKQKEKNAKNKH